VLTVADLKSIGIETVATVLQCSGNGRGYFPSKPSGTPWTVGAAGCVLWSGVPVRYVVEALGGPSRRDGLHHRHRRREAARERRSALGHGRALGRR
jgi:DMSO/TMAO reductase YedYZ molybdopterin-dependent catalytic subunit